MSHNKILEYSCIVKSFLFLFSKEFIALIIADNNGLEGID